MREERFALVWSRVRDVAALVRTLAMRHRSEPSGAALDGSGRGLRTLARTGLVVLVPGAAGAWPALVTLHHVAARWPAAAATIPRGATLHALAVIGRSWQVRPFVFGPRFRLGEPEAGEEA